MLEATRNCIAAIEDHAAVPRNFKRHPDWLLDGTKSAGPRPIAHTLKRAISSSPFTKIHRKYQEVEKEQVNPYES